MQFESVLDMEYTTRSQTNSGGTWLQDLNIDQIIREIIKFRPQYDLSHYFWYFPKNADCAADRRRVLADVAVPEVYEALLKFSEQMERFEQAKAESEKVEFKLQKDSWFVTRTNAYCQAVRQLRDCLHMQKFSSQGMQQLTLFLNSYVNQREFSERLQMAGQMERELKETSLIFTIHYNDISLKIGTLPITYEQQLSDWFDGTHRVLRSPYAGIKSLCELEEKLLESFRQEKPKLFKQLAQFSQQYPEQIDERILRFWQEVQFYLAVLAFEEKMKTEGGMDFCEPEISQDGQLSAEGLYDLALAIDQYRYGQTVVSNEAQYRSGEQFIVLNGPNQGGKTTYARSLGQLVYFTKLGLHVPAKCAKVPYFEELLTHFSVEESMESGRGKLKEELMRLKPMMETKAEGAFVVINELFTTAANYDAYIMGSRVLNYFIGKGCKGIYVTHIKELAGADAAVISMKALLDEMNFHKRTYRIVRSEPEDIGYAGDIVEKYQLTYEQLTRRLKKRGDES